MGIHANIHLALTALVALAVYGYLQKEMFWGNNSYPYTLLNIAIGVAAGVLVYIYGYTPVFWLVSRIMQ